MKPLVLGLILANLAFGAQIRSLLFYPSDSGAKFRLKCQMSSSSNRCSEDSFKQSAKSLCSEKDMVLRSVDLIVCINDLQTKKKMCKFANGDCIQNKEIKTKESTPEIKVEKKEAGLEDATSL